MESNLRRWTRKLTIDAELARNFARAAPTDITAAGVEVPWASIAAGAPPGVVVPITPRRSGRVLLRCVLSTSAPAEARVLLDGVTVGEPVSGATIVPLLVDLLLPVGATSKIGILLTSDAVGARLYSGALDLQEIGKRSS